MFYFLEFFCFSLIEIQSLSPTIFSPRVHAYFFPKSLKIIIKSNTIFWKSMHHSHRFSNHFHFHIIRSKSEFYFQSNLSL